MFVFYQREYRVRVDRSDFASLQIVHIEFLIIRLNFSNVLSELERVINCYDNFV